MLILFPLYQPIQTNKGKYLKVNNTTMTFTGVRSLSKQKPILLSYTSENRL